MVGAIAGRYGTPLAPLTAPVATFSFISAGVVGGAGTFLHCAVDPTSVDCLVGVVAGIGRGSPDCQFHRYADGVMR